MRSIGEECDCLNECGDDRWVIDGKANPCETRKQWLAEQEQHRQDITRLTSFASRIRDKDVSAALKRILDRTAP